MVSLPGRPRKAFMQKMDCYLENYMNHPTKEWEWLLLNECMPILVNRIKGIYGIRDDFEDVLQEGAIVLLKAMRRYQKEKIALPFLAYIQSCGRFYALDLWKKRKESLVSVEKIFSLPTKEGSPEEILIQKERALSLFDALSQLSLKKQEILVHHYLLETPLNILAERWQIPYSTLKKQKRKALLEMKKILMKRGRI